MTATVPVIVTADAQQDADSHAATAAADDHVRAAARRLYDAEIALHIAHQTHDDSWIAAASDRLHDALEEHRAALRAAHRAA